MSKVPNFIACCIDDDEVISNYGEGDTPQQALDDFVGDGSFELHCEMYAVKKGSKVEVFIYSCIPVEDSDWGEEAHPDWEWCLDKKIETKVLIND